MELIQDVVHSDKSAMFIDINPNRTLRSLEERKEVHASTIRVDFRSSKLRREVSELRAINITLLPE